MIEDKNILEPQFRKEYGEIDKKKLIKRMDETKKILDHIKEEGLRMNLKTFEDVEKLALHEPIVYRYLMLYKNGSISRDDALIGIIFSLKEMKDKYFKDVVRMTENKPPQ